ncbi:MAG TPA: Clp protease N-terminal domain-containing protein, partial [Polyangiaceae bacterium]|nr:Clp protease N-terminal domain-containing protein [Polyangiaceae bacterium]
MLVVQPRSLLQRLSPFCTRALETAAATCVSAGHDEVSVDHFFLALLEAVDSDVQIALNHYGVDGEELV